LIVMDMTVRFNRGDRALFQFFCQLSLKLFCPFCRLVCAYRRAGWV
jgi:hypothetical protein